MKIKTSDLIGAALNWAAAKAEYADRRVEIHPITKEPRVECGPGSGDRYSGWFGFFPATSWSQGGPIIEREGIDLRKRVPDDVLRPNPRFAWKAELVATSPYHCGTGPTPLIAVMRCFVAFKLGDEVEIPDELLSS